MWYFYVLQSLKNKRLYKGYTSNLQKRVFDHNQGKGGKYTKDNKPFKLVYYEAYLCKSDASRAEVFYKKGCGREVLMNKLKNYFSGIV